MSKRKTVAVIGGGVSGLAAAKAFDAQGHRVLGYERSHDFGGVWELSRSYPDVQTQSPKDLYCYTDHPMPAENPEWPKGPQVHAYLHSYAAKHKLGRLFHLNTNVVSMDRRADGRPGWDLTLESAGRERSQDVDFVAICTGQFSDKNIIAHPGQDDFIAQGGQVIHSSEYTDPEMIRGKRVAVLGGSKSATDIAVSAAKRGATSVTLVYRQNVWRVPYFVGGSTSSGSCTCARRKCSSTAGTLGDAQHFNPVGLQLLLESDKGFAVLHPEGDLLHRGRCIGATAHLGLGRQLNKGQHIALPCI